MAKPGLHLTMPCEFCGTAYRQARSDQRYCSKKCCLTVWRREHPNYVRPNKTPRVKPPVVALCVVCGSLCRLNRMKYCSEACNPKKVVAKGAGKGWGGGLMRVPRTVCEKCGNLFYAPPSQRRRSATGRGGKCCSRACAMAIRKESWPQTRTRRGRGGKRADLGGVYFRSAWEANWARYLNWLMSIGEIKRWEFEPVTFEFKNIKRGTRFYTPDFRVTNKDDTVEYQEIKGYMDPRSATKLKRMKKHYPHIPITLIDKDAYHSTTKVVSGLIANWESRRT